METAIGTLSILPENKAQIKSFSAKLLSEIEEGNAKPLAVLKTFKAFEKVFNAIKPKLTIACLNEAALHPKGKFTSCGITFEIKEAGTKYDYTNCNDSVIDFLSYEIEKLTDSLKERQDFLKALKEPLTLIDEVTGEINKIYPPVKTSTTVVQSNF